MPESVAVQPRVVPGAPPPPPPSKSQKKHKKPKAKSAAESGDEQVVPDAAAAALIDKAPEAADIQQGIVAPELIATSESLAGAAADDDLLKLSPIVDLIHKRLKAITKKIGRVSVYASTDPDKLNDDQKRTLKTLPTLEAVQKELGEVKKAVEAHEAELGQEFASKRLELEKTEQARIASAVSSTESTLASKITGILTLLHLRATGAIDVDASESAAISALADVLLGGDIEQRQAAVNGLLLGDGSFGDVSYSRLQEITQAALAPPREPTPVQAQFVEDTPGAVEEALEPETPADVSISGNPLAASTSSFRFIQESEIEANFEEGVHVIDKADVAGYDDHPHTNGHATEVPAQGAGTLDWADEDEGGLPPLSSVHAEFKTSGDATPVEVAEEPSAPAHTNGHAHDHVAPASQQPEEGDDGFQQARSSRARGRGGFRGGDEHGRGRGRGRGRGGFRGGDRGGFRGGDREGGHRGGDREGGHRGGDREGGYRGGDSEGGHRGEPREGGRRGGFRGGEGHRGGSRGDWRGGDGERRGGRGRGRGDRGGAHGGNPVPPTPTAT